ncbi:MAG: hypothetical protein WDN26_19160 [Chitinophagaceae bacterium]
MKIKSIGILTFSEGTITVYFVNIGECDATEVDSSPGRPGQPG